MSSNSLRGAGAATRLQPAPSTQLRPMGEPPNTPRGSRAGLLLLAAALAGALAVGCSSSESAGSSFALDSRAASPGAGVGQGGAQDFGAFREMLDQSALPTAELLDDVGFFNEHKIELPAANCDQPVCLHARLGVMGNMVDGSNCTMLFLGMNTLVNVGAARKPLDLALALDTSGSMQGEAIANLVLGLHLMLPQLRPTDRISLVTFDDQSKVVVSGVQGDFSQLESAIDGLVADGGTNIYAGLSTAYAELERLAEADAENDAPLRERRVLLLSDGESTAGFTDPERPIGLARAYTERGISLSTIGIGVNYDAELLRLLSLEGAGSYYFIDQPSALGDVFIEEVRTSLVPLARDATLTVEVGPNYQARAVFGTDRATLRRDFVEIAMPVLQIAARDSASDDELGRRGGGGVIIVELTPKKGVDEDSEAVHDVGTVALTYRDGLSGEDRSYEQVTEIESPLLPGETPEAGHFDDESVEKSFVMLNIYAAMHVALDAVRLGDAPAALTALSSLEGAVSEWLADNPDDDIEADLEVVRQLAALVAQQAPPNEVQAPVPAPPLWGYD